MDVLFHKIKPKLIIQNLMNRIKIHEALG